MCHLHSVQTNTLYCGFWGLIMNPSLHRSALKPSRHPLSGPPDGGTGWGIWICHRIFSTSIPSSSAQNPSSAKSIGSGQLAERRREQSRGSKTWVACVPHLYAHFHSLFLSFTHKARPQYAPLQLVEKRMAIQRFMLQVKTTQFLHT